MHVGRHDLAILHPTGAAGGAGTGRATPRSWDGSIACGVYCDDLSSGPTDQDEDPVVRSGAQAHPPPALLLLAVGGAARQCHRFCTMRVACSVLEVRPCALLFASVPTMLANGRTPRSPAFLSRPSVSIEPRILLTIVGPPSLAAPPPHHRGGGPSPAAPRVLSACIP